MKIAKDIQAHGERFVGERRQLRKLKTGGGSRALLCSSILLNAVKRSQSVRFTAGVEWTI